MKIKTAFEHIENPSKKFIQSIHNAIVLIKMSNRNALIGYFDQIKKNDDLYYQKILTDCLVSVCAFKTLRIGLSKLSLNNVEDEGELNFSKNVSHMLSNLYTEKQIFQALYCLHSIKTDGKNIQDKLHDIMINSIEGLALKSIDSSGLFDVISK